jgi:DNA-binding transcriptional LysR family regulator
MKKTAAQELPVPHSGAPTARQWEVFRAVMQLGSLTRAAQSLHVSQPAVTQAIAQLEARCGIALFQRHGGRMHPTTQAQALLVDVGQLFNELDRIERRVAALREPGPARVRVGCLHAFAASVLGRAVARFRKRYPNAAVDLMVESSRNIREALMAGQLDFGMLADEADVSGLAASSFYALPAVCVMLPSHRLASKKTVAPADLQGEPIIKLWAGDRTQERLDRLFAQEGVALGNTIITPYSQTQCELALAGVGIALTNPLVAAAYGARGLVAVPFRPQVPFRAWLAFAPAHAAREAASQSPVLRAFVAACRTELIAMAADKTM